MEQVRALLTFIFFPSFFFFLLVSALVDFSIVGKSTLVNLIIGELMPTEGEV
jgi:ABC-type transport system involved in cytochrome bd biosynthesis fused ATPase/permease subunit